MTPVKIEYKSREWFVRGRNSEERGGVEEGDFMMVEDFMIVETGVVGILGTPEGEVVVKEERGGGMWSRFPTDEKSVLVGREVGVRELTIMSKRGVGGTLRRDIAIRAELIS